jgi:uncharacterized surface protein with fasciclin (FAS1) repeats
MNRLKKIAAAVAGGVMAATMVAPAASATNGQLPPVQPNSLAAFLTGPQNGGAFDNNPYDWDIVTQAIIAVVKTTDSSVLDAAFNGTTPVTAFLPNDRAFQVLAAEQGAKTSFFNYTKATEETVFNAVAGVAGAELENILKYHVLAGATVTKSAALKSDNAQLTMANGKVVTVDVLSKRWSLIKLRDLDTDDRDPLIIPRRFDLNSNSGKNVQVAHGIDAVLRPFNLK